MTKFNISGRSPTMAELASAENYSLIVRSLPRSTQAKNILRAGTVLLRAPACRR